MLNSAWTWLHNSISEWKLILFCEQGFKDLKNNERRDVLHNNFANYLIEIAKIKTMVILKTKNFLFTDAWYETRRNTFIFCTKY